MILTHLVVLSFFDGAGTAATDVVDNSGYFKRPRAKLRAKSGIVKPTLPGRDYIEQQQIAEEIIRRVAERQAKSVREIRLDDQQRFEELQRELELHDIEWQSTYLENLNSLRDALITLEIKQRLEKKRLDAEDEEVMLLFLMSANV